jgi:hypothetical protein
VEDREEVGREARSVVADATSPSPHHVLEQRRAGLEAVVAVVAQLDDHAEELAQVPYDEGRGEDHRLGVAGLTADLDGRDATTSTRPSSDSPFA